MIVNLKRWAAGVSASLALPVLAVVPIAHAATTIVIAPSNAASQGWSTADTRANGHVNFVTNDSPLGDGSLQLTTDVLPTPSQDKAQYMTTKHVGTPLADVAALSYWTKQDVSHTGFAAGLPSYQLEIDADGVVDAVGNAGFTTMVYEPYNNFGNAAVHNNEWQQWDVDAGTMWSSKTIPELTAGQGGVTAGFGGAPFYSLSDLKAKFPNAIVLKIGVNIGSNNPDYNTYADGVVFNSTTYDFETSLPPVVLNNKDECKNGGWQTSEDPIFKNQGDCVSYFASKGKAKGNPVANFFRSIF